MSIKFTLDTSGLDKLQRKLRNLQSAAEENGGTHQVTLNELFTNEFMQGYTDFSSFDGLLAQAKQEGFKVDTVEEFTAIPDEEWDVFINSHSQFATWEEMKQKGAVEWYKHQLGL
jgi:hypothetical protein